MKRRVISIVTALTLCLSLCPAQAAHADSEPDAELCKHHPVHTEACGYVPPTPGSDCTHEHGADCYIEETVCLHTHTPDCYPQPAEDADTEDTEPEPTECTHECGRESGCVTLTLSCAHVHDGGCGYAEGDEGSPCAFECRLCPVEGLLAALPEGVTEDNSESVSRQLEEILGLYADLSEDEQAQLDMSRCAALWEQLDAANAPEPLSDDVRYDEIFELKEDMPLTKTDEVSKILLIDTASFSYSSSVSPTVRVTGTGCLYLRGDGGSVVSTKGAAVEVKAGGTLTVAEPGLTVTGKTYALDIASGATVKLSGGTYTGETAAINAADGNIEDFLEIGYACFDADGNPIPLSEVPNAKTVVVKECTDHSRTYKSNPGTPTHTWTCTACRVTGTEACTFSSFGENGTAACDKGCGNEIRVVVDETSLGDLVYDSTAKPGKVDLTVTLKDGTKLTENNDYTVSFEARKDVGEITVTVTGKTYNGTFTRTYDVTQDQPELEWSSAGLALDYDGNPVEISDLPKVNITIKATGETETLRSKLEYSHRAADAASTDPFTPGLPTNAGTYAIKASLPEQQNYKPAETAPCLTLTINSIDAIPTSGEPKATQPIYNREAQNLVTAGTLTDLAAADGVVIEFARTENGEYSTEIPKETNAGDYNVWYRVNANDNYNPQSGQVLNVEILPKPLAAPTLDITERSYTYDGSVKSPKIVVRDGQAVVEDDQYTITWAPTQELRNAGKYTATIKSVDNRNYEFSTTATVEIVPAAQSALSITGKPDTVYYGDVIKTLSTAGGDGNGTVTWSVSGNASINEDSGELEIKGTGSVTVKATRTVPNYNTVEATWSFTVEPKPVTAVVTADNKPYDGTTAANVSAKVDKSDLVNGDTVTISGLTGAFDDANAGPNKTVRIDKSKVTASATGKYKISYPDAVTASITPKNVTTLTITLSGNDLQGTPGSYTYTYDGTEKRPNVTVKDGTTLLTPNDYEVSYSNNKNVSTASAPATVTVTASPAGNYAFTAQTVNFEIVKAPAELTATPRAKDLTYDGTAQYLVTDGVASGGTVVYSLDQTTYTENIPQKTDAGTYTVYYKVAGDANHNDTLPGYTSVTIKPKEITPTITLLTTSYAYDGNAKTPTVEVRDGAGTAELPTSEYTLFYSDNINAGTATVTVSNANGGNYIVNGTAHFTIEKAAPALTPPTARTGLKYTGAAQELITRGSTPHGKMEYSLDGANFSEEVPTGTAVGNYEVTYMVKGDENHNDSDPVALNSKVTVSIAKNTVTTLTVELSATGFTYNGQEQKPTITLKDDKGNVIAPNEYTVEYPADTSSVGTYTIKIKSKGTNYTFTDTERQITILPADQSPLTITTDKGPTVYYGDSFILRATGGSGNGKINWSIDGACATINDNGTVTVTGTGPFTVKAYRESNGSYDKSNEDAITFTANPKPITPVVTVTDRPYNGKLKVDVTASVAPGDLVGKDTLTVTATGELLTPDAGTSKPVTVTYTCTGDTGKYTIISPTGVTVSIHKATAKLAVTPEPKTGLVADGSAQALITATETDGDIGTVEYCLGDKDGTYTPAIPTATDAGTYTVWYRVPDTANHTAIAPASLTVTIAAPSTPDTGDTNSDTTDDTDGTTDTTPPTTDETGTVSVPLPASVSGGTAASTLSATAGRALVRQAAAANSQNVVIKPEITGDVTRTEVSLPASTVSGLGSETDADLTVSTPVAGVTIPNAALNTLASSGGEVSVVTERAENAVTLTLSADGERLDSVPGGVTLTVPVEDPAPGTVAVLVNEDGTRETIRKAVPDGGELSVPLSGSATVEIVDNSKAFEDVPPESWEADAVAFASAHELFSGTGEGTFSPAEPMSRAMLATVLYNLEGRPAQSSTGSFSDVSGGAWYADSVSWATEKGITDGYSDGRFGPDESVTREQFAVMLWRYAGSPAAEGGDLSFTDADQISGYASEALLWATSMGILNGYSDGRLDPAAPATRAQAAQMLKNFMENVKNV